MAKPSGKLLKVGEGGMGRTPTDNASQPAGSKSRWWKTQRSSAADKGFDRLSPQWPNSATDEMGRFKHVPVVGRLPWRWQYVVAALGLLAGVVVMALLMARFAEGTRGDGEHRLSQISFRQSLSDIERQVHMARLHPDAAQANLDTAINSGRASLATWTMHSPQRAQMVKADWDKTVEMASQARDLMPSLVAFQASAKTAQPLLATGVSRATTALVNTGPETASARAFTTSVALWSQALDGVVQDGARWPEGLAAQRPGLNAAVNSFSASTPPSDVSPSAQAWRHAGSAWAQASPSINALLANAPRWNQMAVLDDAIGAQVGTTLATADRAAENASAAAWLMPATMLAVAWVVVCLALLIGIGWKQQRFQALAALVAHEQTEAGILVLMEDLRLVADGDLTHRAKVSETPVGTLADMLNETVSRLSGLVKGIKTHVTAGAAASQNAADATGALVDSAREDQAAIVQNGHEIAKVVEGVKEVATISDETKSVSDEAMQAAVDGRSAVSQAHRHVHEIRSQAEEARNRVERLAQSSREIAGIATLINEIADGIGVLAMQAALQAARAGEKGQGFRVVADEVSNLSQRSGVEARRVSALIETALGDIEGAAASMRAVTGGTDESSRLMDISREASEIIEEALEKVTTRANALQTILNEQHQAAQALDANAQESLSRVKESQKRAQAAVEGVMQLFESAREMASSANRFKV